MSVTNCIINKINEIDLPSIVEDPTKSLYIFFTELGNIYINKNDGTLKIFSSTDATLLNGHSIDYFAKQLEVDDLKTISVDLINSIKDINALSSKYIKSCCLYYGYPQAFLELWDNNAVALEMSKYDIIVFGDQYSYPTHEQNIHLIDINAKIKALNPTVEIFGYVPLGNLSSTDSSYTIPELKTRIDWCKNSGSTGIFLDEFGYDYNVTRERQNEIVSYCHSNGLNVIANAWVIDHVFSSINIISNDINCNINNLLPVIDDKDYFIFENLFFSTELDDEVYIQTGSDAYRVNYPSHYYVYIKSEYDCTYYDKFKTKTIALDSIYTQLSVSQKENLIKIGVLGSTILGIDAYACSPQNWGSSGIYEPWAVPRMDDFIISGKATLKVTEKSYNGTDYPYKYEISTYDNKILKLVWDLPTPYTESIDEGTRGIYLNDIQVLNPWSSTVDLINDLNIISIKVDALKGTGASLVYTTKEW